MKKDKYLQMARLLLTPLVMILLGLLLLLRPDSASALVGRVIGWILVVIGGGLVLDSILVRDAMAGRILFAAVTLAVGVWLVRNPLRLAAMVGRIAGLLILIRAAQDIVNASRWNCGMRYAIVSALIGAVLIVLPMTTSRLVMVLLGLVVIVLGGLMAWDRLKLGKLLSDGDDGIIDVGDWPPAACPAGQATPPGESCWRSSTGRRRGRLCRRSGFPKQAAPIFRAALTVFPSPTRPAMPPASWQSAP